MWSLFGKKKVEVEVPVIKKRTLTIKQEEQSVDLGVTTVELTTVDDDKFLTKVYGYFGQDVYEGRDAAENEKRWDREFKEPEVYDHRQTSLENARQIMREINEHESKTYVDDHRNVQATLSARVKSARIVKTEPDPQVQIVHFVVPLLQEPQNG